MNGYQLTFFTQQDRRHSHQPLAEWLMALVQSMQIRGATLRTAQEGIDSHHKLHSAHFFELTDQPVEVTMVVSEEESARLFERLNAEPGLHLFYAKSAVELGTIGESQQP
ncbi:MAG: DUF190 domain-containing protein [Glaciimonas sp.]|nr:DUF190 domain-containing protein [Glaciimonas sp.]